MVEIAAMVGSMLLRSWLNICFGRVAIGATAMNIAITTSSNEDMKVRNAAAIPGGAICGSAMLEKALRGWPRRLRATSSGLGSNWASPAAIVIIAIGSVYIMCAATKPGSVLITPIEE